MSSTKGPYSYTITLSYCATPGYWTHARTVYPTTKTHIENEKINNGIKSEQIDANTGNTIIELDDNNENENDNDVNTNNKSITEQRSDDNHEEKHHQNEISSSLSPQRKKLKSNPIRI